VMARLRDADDARERRTFAPRLAWAGAAMLVLIAIVVTGYSLRSPSSDTPAPDARVPRIAEHAPTAAPAPPPSSKQPTTAVREIPTGAAGAASRVHATTVGRDARDMEREAPLESDIEIVSITPTPLDVPPAIRVEPLTTSSLQVDAIPLPSIEMSPVDPERNE
jgi:hypothetical protein